MPIFRRDQVPAAIRELRDELDGGKRAELPPMVETLSALLLEREARSRAAEREQPERELLAAFQEPVGMVARDGRVRLANAALDSIAPGGRAAGLTALEITRNAELSEAMQRALEGTGRQLEVQLGRRTYQASLAPLLRGEVLLTLRDVTSARRAEAARRDFVANASHELRTPVAAIAGAAETLMAGALRDPGEARVFVEMIARHAERLGRLASDLLDLSRIESGQWSLAPAALPVEPLARRVLDLYTGPASRKRVALRQEVAPDLAALADARALEQVLVNLVDNAVKYTPEGGTVTVLGERRGEDALLSVADTGPGIDRHHLPRIFERFYRVDPGRSRENGGTGLGLAIVKHLVQAQGGDVGVESGASGSRFWLRLPAADSGSR